MVAASLGVNTVVFCPKISVSEIYMRGIGLPHIDGPGVRWPIRLKF